jgi:formylglycine-generating enzyme required for sulfatase activity
VQSGTDPAVCISWNDAKAYATWLSRKTQKTYRLLTEAEWEYVARAGTATRLFFGTDESALAQYAWYKENSGGQTQPVGRKKANAFGLYDVYGNADQWVEDCEHNDYTGAPSDGSAWPSSFCSRHILRGGTWNNDRSPLSSASRNSNFAEYRLNENGFRLARTLTP